MDCIGQGMDTWSGIENVHNYLVANVLGGDIDVPVWLKADAGIISNREWTQYPPHKSILTCVLQIKGKKSNPVMVNANLGLLD